MLDKQKTNRTVIILIYMVVLIAAIIGALIPYLHKYFSIFSQPESVNNMTIELSSSVGDSIYKGGEGELYAFLKNEKGQVLSQDVEFSFVSSDTETLEITKHDKTSCAFKAKELTNEVIINVHCLNIAETVTSNLKLKIINHDGYLITFEYPDKNNLDGNNIKKTCVVNKGETVQDAPVPDFGCNEYYWVIKGTESIAEGVKFNPNDRFFGNDDIEVYAKFKDVILTFRDDLFPDNTYLPQTVRYGEIISNILDWGKPNDQNGWHFEGWFTALDENGLENGEIDGKFGALNNTLFAKWSTLISFDVGLVENSPSLGMPTKSDMKVVYNGIISELPQMNYNYDNNDIIFKGWYSEKFGKGNELKKGAIYNNSKANQTYYAKTEIKALFKDELNDREYDINIIYGTNFADKNIPILYRSGWIFEQKWIIEGVGEITNEGLTDIEYSFDFSNPISLIAVWTVEIDLKADIGDIKDVYDNTYRVFKFGDRLDLDRPSNQYSWQFSGWFANSNYAGEEIDFISTSDIEFIELVDNNSVLQSDGKYRLPLYAKWTTSVSLNYGESSIIEDSFPKVLNLIYGKSIKELQGDQCLPSVEDIRVPDGYINGIGWYSEKAFINQIDNETKFYALNINMLYFKWNGNPYNILLKYVDAGNTEKDKGSIEVFYGQELDDLADEYSTFENKPNGEFLGYFYVDSETGTEIQYFTSKLSGTRKWDKKIDDIILYARFGKSYRISLDHCGGNGGTVEVDAVYGQNLQPAIAPARSGYTFNGYKDDAGVYYYSSVMESLRTWDKTKDITLKADWTANKYNVIFNVNGGNKVYPSSKKVTFDSIYDNLPVPTRNNEKGNGGYTSYSFAGWKISGSDSWITNETKVTIASDHTLVAQWNGTWHKNSCLATGSLITLADGSQKPVEDLIGDESLLVWNMFTGTFDVAPILFIDRENEETYEIINLHFSDGSTVKVIYEHGFWDYNLNKWVFLRSDAKKYIGHWFNKQSVNDTNGQLRNKSVQLIDVVITQESTIAWSPVTYGHLCYYVNGLLSMPGSTEGFVNIFEVESDNMQFDIEKMKSDIEKYGLFTYEDFADHIPEEVFYAFNGQYLKVAIGKELLTWEDILALIEKYKKFW